MTHIWADLEPSEVIALRGMQSQQAIVVRPWIVRALGGDGNAAIVLTQLLYWSRSDMAMERDGWFYLTTQKITTDTGINSHVQERVRAKLTALGILETKREGMPAKNYYRINLAAALDLVGRQFVVGDLTQPSDGTSPHESGSQDGMNRAAIVDTVVRTQHKNRIHEPARLNAKNKTKKNILGDKLERFIQWVADTYPLNALGMGASPEQARKLAYKIGNLPYNAPDDRKLQARMELQAFIRALKNIKAKVDAGEYERTYVPKFDNFAGLGVSYGREPGYKAWALVRKIEPQQEDHGLVI